MTRTGALAAGVICVAVGCGTMKGSKTGFDEARIASVPVEQRQDFTDAKTDLEEAKLSLEGSRRAVSEADNRVRLAEAERDLAKTELDLERKTGNTAVKRGDFARLEDVPAYHAARIGHDAADAKVSYLKELRSYEKARVTMNEHLVGLRGAEVDAAGFAVLERTDPKQAAATGMHDADYAAKVAQQRAAVSSAESDVATHRARAVPLYRSWSDLDRQLGTTSRRAAAPPAPPKG